MISKKLPLFNSIWTHGALFLSRPCFQVGGYTQMTSGHLDPSCCHHVIFWLLGLLTLSEKIWDHCHRPNIPQINRKNCLRNHFWPLKSVFLALGSEERGLFLLGSRRLILTLLFPESEKYFEKFPMSTCFAYVKVAVNLKQLAILDEIGQ